MSLMLRDSLCLSVPTYNLCVFWSEHCLCGWADKVSPLAGTISLISDVATAYGWAISNWWLGLKEKISSPLYTTLGLGGLSTQDTSNVTHPHAWVLDSALPWVLYSNFSLQNAYQTLTPRSKSITPLLCSYREQRGNVLWKRKTSYQSVSNISLHLLLPQF